MAYDMQALYPVYMPKSMTKDETPEEHDSSVAQNEDAMNQNFTNLYNKALDLEERLQAAEAALSTL